MKPLSDWFVSFYLWSFSESWSVNTHTHSNKVLKIFPQANPSWPCKWGQRRIRVFPPGIPRRRCFKDNPTICSAGGSIGLETAQLRFFCIEYSQISIWQIEVEFNGSFGNSGQLIKNLHFAINHTEFLTLTLTFRCRSDWRSTHPEWRNPFNMGHTAMKCI